MTIVKTTAELHAAIEAGTDPKTITIAAAEKVDTDAIRTESAATATASEKARITGIQALSVKGFETEIQTAIDSGATVEAAGLSMFKAAQDRGVTLAGIKSDATKAGAASPAAGTTVATHSTKNIWATRKGTKP